MSELWTRYRVQWDFLTKLCGSVPADPELVAAWLSARKPAVRPPSGKTITEINEEVLATLPEPDPAVEQTEGSILTFQRHEGICCMRAATIRAHVKDCARVLSAQHMGSIKNERAFSTRVINGVYLDPAAYWIPILRPDGTPITKHDGEMDKAVHVRTPQGLVSALKRFEWIQPARLDFTLLVLAATGNKPSVAEEDLRVVMQYGGVHGYAGERGDGEGRYTFTLTKEG